ncbi:MAG TPA: glycine cleavage T C-terminal barrel domain-containing protein [Myxococcota bacterium]|nr:glycine cleavage T C-terminal barrel domain-containing protein [Myxococcota bacterium]
MSARLYELPERGVLEVAGADRTRWLDGMLTNEVKGLAAGGPRSGCHALALTREGRIVAEVHVLARPDALLLETERTAIAPLAAHLARFVVADDVTLRDASAAWVRLALEGDGAGEVLAAALGVAAIAPDAVVELPEGAGLVAGYSLSGAGGVQLLAPVASAPALRDRLLAAGATPGSAVELEALRIEHAVPRQGRELTLEVLPAEARLERAVSETKGCYTGQEVVTRMRARDRVSHLLVALRFDGALPAPGTELRLAGREVGSITSAVQSPRLGPIGLGFVRRADAEPGTKLEAGGVVATIAGD